MSPVGRNTVIFLRMWAAEKKLGITTDLTKITRLDLQLKFMKCFSGWEKRKNIILILSKRLKKGKNKPSGLLKSLAALENTSFGSVIFLFSPSKQEALAEAIIPVNYEIFLPALIPKQPLEKVPGPRVWLSQEVFRSQRRRLGEAGRV